MSSDIAETFYSTLKDEVENLLNELTGKQVRVSVYGRTIMVSLPDRIKIHTIPVKVDNITRKADAVAVAKMYAQRVVEDILQGE